MHEFLQTSALFAATLGVFLGAFQLWRTRVQAITAFEDQFTKEYRRIMQGIPVAALLGDNLSEGQYQEVREYVFNYIDLSNDQLFHRMVGRVSKRTWNFWQDGLKANLSKPVFARVWSEIKEKDPYVFSELRRLEDGNFALDPRKWK